MTLVLDLTPELETRLHEKAAQRGQEPNAYALRVLEHDLIASENQVIADESDPAYLLTLPLEERRHIMARQAELAAPLYEADLALPVMERELTAFTALDGDPILENYIMEEDDATKPEAR